VNDDHLRFGILLDCQGKFPESVFALKSPTAYFDEDPRYHFAFARPPVDLLARKKQIYLKLF
jgi:hypothetical protein